MTRHLLALGASRACCGVHHARTDAFDAVGPTGDERRRPDAERDGRPPRSRWTRRAPPAELPGTLLVRADDGGMTVLRPDATHPVDRGRRRGRWREVQQAMWSPDGRWIAWSELAVANGRAEAHVVVSAPDGSGRRESFIPFPPFYLSWDPTSSRVAFLGGEEPFTLGLVERRGDAGARSRSRRACPFYLSWGPTGDRMVTHVGSEGSGRARDRRRGDRPRHDLAAPGAVLGPRRQHRVRDRPAAGDRVRARGARRGVGADPPARRPRGGRLPRGLARRLAGGVPRPWPRGAGLLRPRAPGRGHRPRRAGRRHRRVGRGGRDAASRRWRGRGARTVAGWPSWSRCTATRRSGSGGGSGPTGSFTTPPFSGSITFLQEAAFFTQFAQSTTMWSPDSSAFAYPAEGDAGSMIWVQPAAAGAQPFVVGAGSWVGWSPA